MLKQPRVGSDRASENGIEAGQAVPNDNDDRALFEEVFLPHLAEAHRLARWLAGSATDAEDVVQEAAVRAFRGIKSFGAVNARAWSLSIVRNTAYTWLLKNRPRGVVFTEELGVADQQRLEQAGFDGTAVETPEDIALRQVNAVEVQKAIAALPAPFREVIVLREMHDLNYRDISEITNIPIGTVMSRLSRARQMLIEALGSEES